MCEDCTRQCSDCRYTGVMVFERHPDTGDKAPLRGSWIFECTSCSRYLDRHEVVQAVSDTGLIISGSENSYYLPGLDVATSYTHLEHHLGLTSEPEGQLALD